jgi:hypothetical protein
VRVFDVEADAVGDHVLAEDQNATDVLVAPDVRTGRRVFHRRDGIHLRASLGLLGIIDHQVERLPRYGAQGHEELPSLLGEGGLGIPALH